MELGSRAIGTRGELLVAEEFLKRGCAVYTPLVDAGADMVVDLKGRLLRVQVKAYDGEADSHVFKLGHRSPLRSGWLAYDENEFDWYALCWLSKGFIAMVPAGGATTIGMTLGTDRCNEIEIGKVLDRLMKED